MMTHDEIPHFIINNKYQKRSEVYADTLTPNVLKDICEKITGCSQYSCDFINEVNVGRLATLQYQGTITYVSFPETSLSPAEAGRNSSVQSVPTAYVRYYNETNVHKRMCLYFLPSQASYETDYLNFSYRLMSTAGIEFLNADVVLSQPISPFTTVEDMIATRNINKSLNKSNNSTYITKADNIIQIYGKTYGANKKETTLFCIALSKIAITEIELYVICEKKLTTLPAPDLEVIRDMNKIKVIPTNLTMERAELERQNGLRSPRFIYNLLKKIGPKKCEFCECEIPELIQGAHIWPVAEIKADRTLNTLAKILHATDGDNGIWLCENHHKMLDKDLLKIKLDGTLEHKPNIEKSSQEYILKTTPITRVSTVVYTPQFTDYLKKRYKVTP